MGLWCVGWFMENFRLVFCCIVRIVGVGGFGIGYKLGWCLGEFDVVVVDVKMLGY